MAALEKLHLTVAGATIKNDRFRCKPDPDRIQAEANMHRERSIAQRLTALTAAVVILGGWCPEALGQIQPLEGAPLAVLQQGHVEQELAPYRPAMAQDSPLPASSVFAEATTTEIEMLYEKDPQRAEFNYRGRVMVITGIVYRVEGDYIRFASYDGARSNAVHAKGVKCYFFERQRSLVNNLKRGDRIAMEGTVLGYGPLRRTVEIAPCTIL